MSENLAIGIAGKLPWHMPADLKHFKALTLGKPILMGRKTWESLPGILPDRDHYVLTRDVSYRAQGCTVVHSINEVLSAVQDAPELMVVGGTFLFEQFLPLAQRLYMTLVHTEVEGDAFFPQFDLTQWKVVAREDYPADNKNVYPYSFITLYRK